MTREKQIKLLMMDGCTKSEAINYLKRGSMIFDDLEENIESYLKEWNIETEYKNEYRKMVQNKIPCPDWGIVETEENTYYIEYVL